MQSQYRAKEDYISKSLSWKHGGGGRGCVDTVVTKYLFCSAENGKILSQKLLNSGSSGHSLIESQYTAGRVKEH